jgi:hypothetical protein
MKIKCPACDFENEEDAKFCSNCNEPLFNVKDSEIRREGPYIKKENKEHHDDNLGLEPRNKKTKPLYYIIGLILFLCILAYFLGPKLGTRLGWFLTPSYTTLRVSKAPNVWIDIDDPDYPLEFISDGYKFTNIVEKRVNWVWQYIVLNKSDKKLRIAVEFKLKDRDNFIISSSTEEKYVEKHSEITIKGGNSIPIYELKRVYDRTWTINYYEY